MTELLENVKAAGVWIYGLISCYKMDGRLTEKEKEYEETNVKSLKVLQAIVEGKVKLVPCEAEDEMIGGMINSADPYTESPTKTVCKIYKAGVEAVDQENLIKEICDE